MTARTRRRDRLGLALVLVGLALLGRSAAARLRAGDAIRARDAALLRLETDPSTRLDLARAPARDLALVPGLGPVLARRIVAHRERVGPLEDPLDLSRVAGLGTMRSRELTHWFRRAPPGPTPETGR